MELQQFSIHKALSFIDENAGVEIMFVLSNIREENGCITANFVCCACLNKDAGEFSSVAGGQVRLTLGEPSHDAMPERPKWANNFINTNVEFFYESLAELGYGYTGMFQGVTNLQRANGGSMGTLTIPQDEDSAPQNSVIHPATLDVAFQAVFAAVGAPGDGHLWTLHVPTMINSITVNPSACEITSGVETPLPFDACLADAVDDGIAGDVDIYDEDGRHAIVQVQGLNVTLPTKTSPADDRDTFAAIEWEAASPDLIANWTECALTDDEEKMAKFAERLSLYVLRHLCETVPVNKVERNGTEHQRAVLEWAQQVVQTTRAGKHATCPKVWLADTWDALKTPAERLAQANAQIRLCLWVKERLEPFMRDEMCIEDELESSQIMDDLHTSIPYYQVYTERLGGLVKQISFKHRNLKVLEIGTDKGVLHQDSPRCAGRQFHIIYLHRYCHDAL
jgi:hybrid polyketide synthase / nonribosomal peptide synthetase ACE1